MPFGNPPISIPAITPKSGWDILDSKDIPQVTPSATFEMVDVTLDEDEVNRLAAEWDEDAIPSRITFPWDDTSKNLSPLPKSISLQPEMKRFPERSPAQRFFNAGNSRNAMIIEEQTVRENLALEERIETRQFKQQYSAFFKTLRSELTELQPPSVRPIS